MNQREPFTERPQYGRIDTRSPQPATTLLTEYVNLRRLIPHLAEKPIALYGALAELVDIGLTIALEVPRPKRKLRADMEYDPEKLQWVIRSATTDPDSVLRFARDFHERALRIEEEEEAQKRWEADTARMAQIHDELESGEAIPATMVQHMEHYIDREGVGYSLKDGFGDPLADVLQEDLGLAEKIAEQHDRKEHRLGTNALRGYRREIERVLFHYGVLDLRKTIYYTARSFGSDDVQDAMQRASEYAEVRMRGRQLEPAPELPALPEGVYEPTEDPPSE